MKVSFSDILDSKKPRLEKLTQAAERIRAAKGYSWVGIYDAGESEIRIVAWAGRSEPAFPSFPRDKGLNGRAIARNQTVIVNDTDKDEDYLLTFTNTKSEIVVLVSNKKQIVGSIDVESETINAFDDDDAAFLEDCAQKISGLWS